MTEHIQNRPGRKPNGVSRTQVQKQRRREVLLAKAETAALARYAELKREMERAGLRIGPLPRPEKYDDPARHFEVLSARVDRWDALWSITKRKRETRGKIIIGGAILAKLADLVVGDEAHGAFMAAIVAVLNERVERVRDRLIVRELIGGETVLAYPCRSGPAGLWANLWRMLWRLSERR